MGLYAHGGQLCVYMRARACVPKRVRFVHAPPTLANVVLDAPHTSGAQFAKALLRNFGKVQNVFRVLDADNTGYVRTSAAAALGCVHGTGLALRVRCTLVL